MQVTFGLIAVASPHVRLGVFQKLRTGVAGCVVLITGTDMYEVASHEAEMKSLAR